MKQRRTFSTEFKHDPAALVLDKGYRALDVGKYQSYSLIQTLSHELPLCALCAVFEVPRFNYYAHCQRAERVDEQRLLPRKRVSELFVQR